MYDQQASVLFKQNYSATGHIVVNQGGTSSGKTCAIVQTLFCLACETGKLVITVVGQDIPNLKSGVLRDAKNIYSSSATLQAMVKKYNQTDRIFEFHNESAKYPGPNHQQGKSVKPHFIVNFIPLLNIFLLGMQISELLPQTLSV